MDNFFKKTDQKESTKEANTLIIILLSRLIYTSTDSNQYHTIQVRCEILITFASCNILAVSLLYKK